MVLTVALMLSIGAAAPAGSDGPLHVPVEPVTPEVAAARIAACGFKSVRSRFDDGLQEDVVEVHDVAAASPEQLRCAALASLDTLHFVVFPAEVEQAYRTLYRRMSDERDRAHATAWLASRNLLSRLPRFDPKLQDDPSFTRALETLCGPRAAGTLKPMRGMATFEEGALDSFGKDGAIAEGRLDEETFSCLINAATATGYPLGFIGNEAYEKQP